MNELERVALLAAKFGRGGAKVGIGDDAAVLDPVAEPLVWTIDAQVEGTHFRLDWLDWHDVGWRSFMAAASDLAAMGATPLVALSALVLAAHVDDACLAALADGQAEAARLVGAPIVGGNLARGTETSVTTTLLGRAARPVLRSGARVGDGVYLGGAVGLAAAGLAALLADVQSAAIASCLDAWRRPRARLDLSLGAASAAIDVSDGLARDAAHVADASGVTFALDEVALRALAGDPLLAAGRLLTRDPLDLMLHGGEDYALLATSASPLEGFDRIGTVTARGPAALLLGDRALEAHGFDHFVRGS